MIKKNNSKSIKLINYYKLINHNLIYNNKAINRLKRRFELSADKAINLNKLKNQFTTLKIVVLKIMRQTVFSDGNPKSKIMLIVRHLELMRTRKVCHLCRAGVLLDKMLAAIDLDEKKYTYQIL